MVAPIKHAWGGSVLVVDEEVHTIRGLSEVLKTTPYVLARCTAVDDVRRYAAESGVCAIVSDTCFRKNATQELLSALQSQNPDIPIIILSDGIGPTPIPAALSCCPILHLTQPVLPDRFVEAVAQAARSYRMTKFRRRAAWTIEEQAGYDESATLQTRFERALQRIRVAYQPIVSARNGMLFGYEGQLQCDDADFSSPESLIGLAARLGKVIRLGQVIRARATEALLADSGFTLFLNLHPLEVVDPDLHDYRRPITSMASRVVFGMSENAALQDIGCAKSMLASLRDRGFRTAAFDTGAGPFGPSNFAILDPEFVKIDRRLIQGLDTSPGKQELVGSMATYFRALGLSVIADGVQTAWERRWASELGCDLLQGDFLPPDSYPSPCIRT